MEANLRKKLVSVVPDEFLFLLAKIICLLTYSNVLQRVLLKNFWFASLFA